ncbi:hypothetical protein [Deinococcus sp. JMULE3]|uniref:hypothetical protein n=1 Tax=Deinococcus sp. JMULE3 TaxID=2518341 RepID=UPI001576FD66|nr:hypothetical protein [Deinococcus sp. JMULE3]NTX99410.1 hypothetical protein [Deinococcus sp. JMULE3]
MGAARRGFGRQRFRGRAAALSGALLAGGLLSGALAQTLPDPPECGATEALLEVVVGGAPRGAVAVRLSPDVTASLVPPDVLRGAEGGYVAGTVTCDGLPFVRLSSQVTVSYDQPRQRLLIRPRLDRLQGDTLNLAGVATTTAPRGQPVWGVEYGVDAQATYALRGDAPATLAASVNADLAGAAGAWSGSVGALLERTDGSWQAQPRAQVALSVTDRVSVGAAWNAQPLEGSPGLSGSDFRGVGVAAQGGFTLLDPERRVELPLEADVRVFLDGVEVAARRAGPGVLRLTDIPHPAGSAATLQVEVTDETGVRVQEWVLDADPDPLPRGAYLAAARAGVTRGAWGADLRGEYGLGRGWRVGASGGAGLDGTLSAGVRVSRSDARGGVQASVQVSSQVQGGARTTVTTLGLRGETQLGAARVSAFTVLPFGAWQDTQLGAALNANLDPWTLSVSARTALRRDAWTVEGSATRAFGTVGNVTFSAAAQPGGWRLGLSGGYRPTARWDLTAGVRAAQAPAAPDGTTSPVAWQGGAGAAFQVDPANRVTANVTRDDLTVGGSHVGRVTASGQVGLRGAQARVQGAVVVLPGGLSAQATLGQRAVLLQTGVPGLSIILGGAFVGRTDASGSILLSGFTPGETTEVRVDLRDAPFGVQVGTDRRVIVPPQAGLLELDWRSNFRVLRWVQVRGADGQPVAEGSVTVDSGTVGSGTPGSGTVLLDDEGYGLFPAQTGPVRAEVRAATGEVLCTLDIAPGAAEVHCPAGVTP